MGTAGSTNNLGPDAIGIRCVCDSARNLLVEARPAAAVIKFIAGFIKRGAASAANIDPFLERLIIFATERRLCSLMDDYSFLGRSQFIQFHILIK